MEFGFITMARDPSAIPATVRVAEETGWDLFGLADSPALACDPWMALSVGAQHSSRIFLGPVVTNPLTRHPLILSNLSEALDRLSGGRAFLGLGTGNSVMAGVGRKSATLETLADAVRLVRALTAGEPVEVGGAPIKVWGAGRRIPIAIAGSGPKILRLTGAIADWAFITLGSDPEVVCDALGWVREGAIAAGRDPNAVQPWVFLPAAIALDRDQARAEVVRSAIGAAAYVLRGDVEAKRIPPEVRPKINELVRSYHYGTHLTPGSSPNMELADRLGLTDYLVDHCSIHGDPDDCIAKLARLRAVGAERFCFSFSAAPDLERYVRLFGEHVLPAVRGVKAA